MSSRAFTLVEVIVVMAVVALVLPLLFATMFILLQQQRAIIRVTEVKREGDAVIDFVERTIRTEVTGIRDATGTPLCTSIPPFTGTPQVASLDMMTAGASSTLQFVVHDGRLCLNTVGSNDCTSATARPLTSRVVTVSDLVIQCARSSASSNAFVQMQFTIRYAHTGASRPEDTAQMDFQTKVQLRNIQ